MIFDMAANALQLVKATAKLMVSSKGFDKVLEKVEFLSAGAGKCTAQLVVAQEHLNKGDTLHGGMTATLVDIISTLALITNDKAPPGVSVDIHITYMNAAKEGETLLIDASTLKSGKSLAYLDVNITEKITGKIIAKGSHTKYIRQKTELTEQ